MLQVSLHIEKEAELHEHYIPFQLWDLISLIHR